MSQNLFRTKSLYELKKMVSEGHSIHSVDSAGYNLYLSSPIEYYPYLKSQGVDVNQKSVFEVSLLFSITNPEKLSFLLENGLDKNYLLKNKKSPYKEASLEKTKILLKYNVPYKKEDLSTSLIIQEYLISKNILSKKEIKVTGIMLNELKDEDFKNFTLKYKEVIIDTYKKDDSILLLSKNKLKILKENKISINYNLPLSNIRNIKILKDGLIYDDYECLKLRQELKVKYKIGNKKNYFMFKDFKIIKELLNQDGLTCENFDINFYESNILREKNFRTKKDKLMFDNMLDFFSNDEQWMKSIPFLEEVIFNMDMYKLKFIEKYYVQYLPKMETIMMLLQNSNKKSNTWKIISNNLTKEEFEKIKIKFSKNDMFMLFDKIRIEKMLLLIKEGFLIDWFGKYKLEKFISTYLKNKNNEDCIVLIDEVFSRSKLVEEKKKIELENIVFSFNKMDKILDFAEHYNIQIDQNIFKIIEKNKIYLSEEDFSLLEKRIIKSSIVSDEEKNNVRKRL